MDFRDFGSDDLEYTITGLEGGTGYDVGVRAANSVGAGAWSATATRTTSLSDDAALSALALTGLRLEPAFDSGIMSYTATVGYEVRQVTVGATSNYHLAGVEFLDGDGNLLADAEHAALGHQVDFAVGDNIVGVEVTAQDGVTTLAYTVTVTRQDPDQTLTPAASDPEGAVPVGGGLPLPVPRRLDRRGHTGRCSPRRGFHARDRRRPQRRGGFPPEWRAGQSRGRGDGGDRRPGDPQGGDQGGVQRGECECLHRCIEPPWPHRDLNLQLDPDEYRPPAGDGGDQDPTDPRLVHGRLGAVPARRLGPVATPTQRGHLPVGRRHRTGRRLLVEPDDETVPRGLITSMSGAGPFTTDPIGRVSFLLREVTTERTVAEDTPPASPSGGPSRPSLPAAPSATSCSETTTTTTTSSPSTPTPASYEPRKA